MDCFFVCDLHGYTDRYEKLFRIIGEEPPDIVLFGGDLLPSFTHKISFNDITGDFIDNYFLVKLYELRNKIKESYPEMIVIFGNDDLKSEEYKLIAAEKDNLLKYINLRKIQINNTKIFGYSYVPPSPFLLKDWEKYDVSRFVDPGSVSPEEGFRSVEIDESTVKFSTIKNDLKTFVKDEDVSDSIFLFHSPPYKTNLDRLDNDGKMVDYVPIDNYAGSIAIRDFILEKQPRITLHGHIHESARKTGSWKDKIGKTFCFSAADDGPALSIVKFNTESPESAERILV